MNISKQGCDKVFLENLIFYHASLTGEKIASFQGSLLVEKGKILTALVALYNGLFTDENKAFLAEELMENRRMLEIFRKEYLKEKKKHPTKSGFYLDMKKPRL
ncbi:MAG: hypothetical protein IJ016_02605 [Elusimicrobiaceae bacterium]|nr:hypothetical protein [Elusimicrobiaceae bacterium]